MKRLRVLLAIVAMLTLSLMIAGCGGSSSGGGSTDNTVSLTILETSDVHDHAGGYGSAASYSPMVTGNDGVLGVLGGYARLASYISDVKNQKGANNVLLCDDGDFTMGTVYTMTLGSASPLSFMFFSIVGYDAITIGNHEVELGPNALYSFINSAKNNTTYPFSTPIVASNMNASGSAAITSLITNGPIVKSMIIEKAGIKIGILGRMGANAVFDSPNAAPLTFDSGTPDSPAAYAALQAQVDDLRNNQGAQLVVLLSHEGFTNSGGIAVGNDANLAEAVSGIDVILSGHLHINQTALKTLHNTHNTILVEPGEYGEHIARLDLKVDKTTGKVTSYTSTNPIIDDSIVGDSWMNYIVGTEVNTALNTALNTAPPSAHSAFYSLFKWADGSGSILDTVAINNAPINDTSITSGYTVGESVLGNLAADSYRTAINGIWAQAYAGSSGNVTYANGVMAAATVDPSGRRVDIAFVPGGVIRDPLAVEDGTISFADLYNVVPLGADPLDSTAFGYPLLTTYIKAADIYTVVGIALSYGAINGNSDYYINFAGIYVQVTNWLHTPYPSFVVYLCPPDTNPSSPNNGLNGNLRTNIAGTPLDPADTTTTYKIAVDLYTYMMMKALAGAPFYITIHTYDSAGNPIANVSGNRVWTSGTTTMRPWQAMEAWSWAAGAHATSNLSNAGYYTAYPYPRVY
jgi:2',3'-cyclic-nucleotide 2'-phosphodiesterase (5'-nucleotidase family)